MIINIHGKIPSDESLLITVNNEKKILDDLNHSVSFNIINKKNCEIKIEQELAKNNLRPHLVLFFLLTSFIQGIFNIFMINTNSKWYNNIKPYCLKAKLTINSKNDTEINFTYVNSMYDEKNQKWVLPVFTVDSNIDSSINFEENSGDFKNQYFNYIKRVLSVVIVLMTMFIMFLYVAIVNSINIAIIFVSILMLGFIILVVILFITQHKKLIRLYQCWLQKTHPDNFEF